MSIQHWIGRLFGMRDTSVGSVVRLPTFDTAGWQERQRSETNVVWTSDHGDVLTVNVSASGDVGPVSDHGVWRALCRRLAEDLGGGIVSGDSFEEEPAPLFQFIYKREDGAGYLYGGQLFIPRQETVWVIGSSCREHGVTGTREALVTAQLAEEGRLEIERSGAEGRVRNWFRDPYEASQVLKDAVPKISRIVYLYDPRSNPPERAKTLEHNAELKLLRVAARPIPFSDPGDAEGIAKKIDTAIDGLILENSPSLQLAAQQLCAFARKRRLPALGTRMSFAEAGCLIGYGEDEIEWTRQMAIIVHKILMGAKPGEVPIEQPVKVKLVINLKTAKALGLTIPQSLLQRADQVIE